MPCDSHAQTGRYGDLRLSLSLLIAIALLLAVAVGALIVRRVGLAAQAEGLAERYRAVDQGSARARLQHPVVDLAHCIGCGLCVEACPEEGVLEMVHGQALVVHGARCVGHARCAEACPVGALAVTLGDLSQRDDIPALTPDLEAVGSPGLFLAGEVTGYALIRTAIAQGSSVADAVGRRPRVPEQDKSELDLVIVGAGPAGLACALEARRQGLRFVVLDQATLGGTVASYPRRKLVMTHPVDLPLAGRLDRPTYSKEELMELWERVAAEQELPIETGTRFLGLERHGDSYCVNTDGVQWRARQVCLALGRRGVPRKLGVPGEDLPKVAYSLLDAQSYRGRRILVVGGGDSAIEAALGLAEQEGNEVTLSYRKECFFRLKARNEARITQAIQAGRLVVLFSSQVRSIHADHVELTVGEEQTRLPLPNDEVFIFAGGEAPMELLRRSGVSFDVDPHSLPELAGRGKGLLAALGSALALVMGALAWVLIFREYYMAAPALRASLPDHALLRPSRGVGLAFGIAAALLLVINLSYLARRSLRIPLAWGSLQRWMSAHVATGIACLVIALLHSALTPLQTVGGHALWGLALLVVTGAIGRYFYAYVPHAANGRELALEEVRARLREISAEWDRVHRGFAQAAREELDRLALGGRWKGLLGALAGLRERRRIRRRLEQEARRADLSEDQLLATLELTRRASRAALAAAHYEELRGLMASWRYLHRWVALAVVLLVAAHVVTAFRYAELFGGGS